MSEETPNIVLVIVAHSDDETLGLGGTILRHKNQGDKIYGIAMTNGISARTIYEEEQIDKRKEAAYKAANLIGLEWLDFGDFPDNSMDSIPLINIVKFIENVKKDINPKIIYTHSASDLNIDHKIVNESTLIAFRPKAGELWEEIRSFEVPSSTDYSHKTLRGNFNPNLYINIENYIDLKLEALSFYKDELWESPNSRSIDMIKVLAQYRGSQVGLRYAEAFEVLRRISR